MKESLIKLYFYVTSGQAVIDKFKYLIMGIFAVYALFKFTNPIYMVLMFLVAVPILFVFGWLHVHYISRLSEQLSVKYGTFYSIRTFEITEETLSVLKEIRESLKR